MRLLICLVFFSSLFAFQPAAACSSFTPAGEAARERAQQKFLWRETDKRVFGAWHQQGEDENHRFGYIEVKKRGRIERYRLSIPRIINCGFPFYYLEDGDKGRFFLKFLGEPDADDLDAGFIDTYDFVHFKPKR